MFIYRVKRYTKTVVIGAACVAVARIAVDNHKAKKNS